MAKSKKIELYQLRSFSQKIDVTFEFIRQNLKVLFISCLIVILPLAIISGFGMNNMFNTIFGLARNPDMIDDYSMGMSFLSSYGSFFLVSIIVTLFLSTVTNEYLRLYHEREDYNSITVKDVFSAVWKDIWKMLALFILTGLIIGFGYVLLIIPGIIFLVIFSIGPSTLVFERNGPGNVINRTFKLIKSKWFSTFGLMIVTGLIAGFVASIFSIPFYIVYFQEIFTLAQGPELYQDPSPMKAVLNSLAYSSMFIGSYLSYIIVYIALAFQYFNLVELHESRGLIDKIQGIETT